MVIVVFICKCLNANDIKIKNKNKKETLVESFQNRAFRIVTNQFVSTPTEALQMEANVQNYTTISQRNILNPKKTPLRCAADHP